MGDGILFILDTLGQELALCRKLLAEKDEQLAALQKMLTEQRAAEPAPQP